MNAAPRLGLRGRFLVLLAVTVLGAALLLALAWQQQRRAHREMAEFGHAAMRDLALTGTRTRGEALAQTLADALANPLYYFDLSRIGELAGSALLQPDVELVIVFDAHGAIVHDGSPDIAAFGQPMSDPFAAAAVAADSLALRQADDRVEVAMPIRIGRERIGGVRVALSLAPALQAEAEVDRRVRQQLADASRRGMLYLGVLLGGLLLLGAGLSWAISRGLVRPIRALADAARQIEAGNYAVELPSGRHDELGELQGAFARMSRAVALHEAEIRRIAYTDALTGLPNRLALRERLERRLFDVRSAGRELALVFIDLDDFKRINDSAGHDAGDEALEQFAQRMQQCLALAGDPDGLVARFGGDEFVLLFGGHDVRELARQIGEAVLVELQRPLVVLGKPVFLGASIGITVAPDDGSEPSQLVKNGDIAMYQAKVAGKNCLRYYHREMDQALGRSVALEQALRGAWDRGELSLSFQPIYDLANRRLVGAEALLRWQHPELGQVGPDAFVEIAERSSLIDEIGRRVLLEACAAATRWPGAELPPFVAVNVSPRQLRSNELPQIVSDALRDSGLPATRLHIELTETAVLADQPQIVNVLTRLRALGVQIWLDDFGTGFSGLSHLRRVPVDGLKIDRSFIADLLRDPDDLALTTAIIALGHSLGITVVAEGVESEQQFALLRDRGCDYAQGFWLGRPVPDAEFSARVPG